MPGLFGIVTSNRKMIIDERLGQGLVRLLRQPWHFSQTHVVPGMGMASAQREGPLSGGDLWVSSDGNLAVVIDGELYNTPGVTASDGSEHVVRYPTSRCGAKIGALYRRYGDKWVTKVRGAFAVAIWDGERRELRLFADRYGLRPLCYTRIGDTFAFGSSMAALTAGWPEADWQLNWDAVADWFTFQHVLGEKTFVKQIELLPNAGWLWFKPDTGEMSLGQYWEFDQVPSLSHITFNEAVEESCRLFGEAIDEQSAGHHRLGVYLTSGLDSRTIVGYLARRGLKLSTATYGLTGCRDMVWGEALARRVGSQHTLFPMDDASWVRRYAGEFLAASESFVSCFNGHGINTYRAMQSKMNVHLSGVGGGSFAGGDTTTVRALAARTNEERAEALYRDYVFSMGNIFCYPMERMYLFQPGAWAEVNDRAEMSFQREFQRYAHLRPDIVGDAFTLSNRYKKMFVYMTVAERDFFENRLPFMDYRFLDFVFAIPTALRLKRRLQIGMLDRAVPGLTWVPWQATATLPTLHHGRRELYNQIARLGRYALQKVRPDYRPPFEPGRNYPLWLRQDALPWTREVLDSDEVEARGVMNRSYLCDLLNRANESAKLPYQEQRNLTYRIGAALSFEWMCRRVFDHRE